MFHHALSQVGKTRLYTPQAEDVGSVLKVDIVSCDTAGGYAREVCATCLAASRSTVPVGMRRTTQG